MIPFIKENLNIPKFGAELRWPSLLLRCCYFPLFREGAERLSDLPGLTSLPGDQGIGGAGGIHQLRTCSFFNNQSHTPADASGSTASLIKPEQTPVCSVRRASGSEGSLSTGSRGSLPLWSGPRTRRRPARHLGPERPRADPALPGPPCESPLKSPWAPHLPHPSPACELSLYF